MIREPSLYYLPETFVFPNSRLPVIHYHHVLRLPRLFKGRYIKDTFARNQWTNTWDSGIFTYPHYHSTTHEVLGFYKGHTVIQLGGTEGPKIVVTAGDVLIIPAGVAHKNLGRQHQIKCIGAYPDGRDFDINTGKPGERPTADLNIAALPIPVADPVYGPDEGTSHVWTVQPL